ncbi:MAG TPA: anti-sigma factor [Acidimicrobiia bacterium]|nr:anti-sigma factor [Acidimicrobiia bacterium]
MMASDETRAQDLASGSGDAPRDYERLDLIRGVLAGEATWVEPPPAVVDALLAAVAHEAPGSADGAVGAAPARWPLVVAAVGTVAAAVALVLSTISVIDAQQETVVAMEGTELEVGAWGQAAVRPTESGWWILLDLKGLPPAPEGSFYEGWVWSDDGDGVSIGTFHLRGGDAPVVLWSGVEMADYPSIWVTLEHEDEGAEASDLVIMTGRMPDAPEA